MHTPARALDPSKLPTFAKHLAEANPDRLHHYTGQSGLRGIIEKSELWATKVQYMNDATEFTLGLDLAKERIQNHLDSRKDHRDKLVSLFPRRDGIAYVNIFVACFCEKPDLLSQWRGYAGENYGYSLAFNGAKLRRYSATADFSLAKCIYDKALQITIVDELIEHCLKIDGQFDMQAEFESGLLLVSAFFKAETFNEEQEWRIVSNVKSIRDDAIGFREGKSMLAPYYAVKIGEYENSAIEAATVGPCPHKLLSQSSVQMMFLRHGLAKGKAAGPMWPEVHTSAVPYRNW